MKINPVNVLVAGAGGFIGGHLVNFLVSKGHSVRAVDIKPFDEWFQINPKAIRLRLDLRLREECFVAVRGVDEVYNLAADMGGMGFIEKNKALCMMSVLINTHLLQAAYACKVKKYFYASSACVYNANMQGHYFVAPLREEDAYPAMPEDGYGWEKLFSERMCRHYMEDFELDVRVARFHNVYGPHGTYKGGREKAPAAICRKVIEAMLKQENTIEIWGNGKQTRSFMYIDDCIEGIARIMNSEHSLPINLGSSEQVSINQLVDIVETIASLKTGSPVKLNRQYVLTAPQGVNGRSSDNTRIKSVLKWEPTTSLFSGLTPTFEWIYEQVCAQTPKAEGQG